jgi:hypothetical protein
MVFYLISFFQLSKEVLHKEWITFDQDSFGKEIARKRNTEWLSALPTKRSWRARIHDLEVKNRALLGKWLHKLLAEDGVCRHS